MPNWAEGNIRLRGKRDNILSFLRSELIAVDDNFGTARPISIKENRGGWSIILRKPSGTCNHLYFKGSDGQYIMNLDSNDAEIELSDGPNKNVDQIAVVEDFNGAWDVDRNIFQHYATTYKIDIRVFVWEQGMCWSTIGTFYRDGKIDSESKQYSNWLWDSPLPYYGG